VSTINSTFTLNSVHSYDSHYNSESLYSDIKLSNNYQKLFFSDLNLVNNIIDKTILFSNIESGLLPPGVRNIFPGVVIFERPPTMKLVQYINNNVNEIASEGEEFYDEEEDQYTQVEISPIKSHYIPIPWQIYIASYSTRPGSEYLLTSIRMYFSNSPLNHDSIRLYSPYVPNFFTDGLLCNPMIESYEEIDRYSKNVTGVIESAYDWVWNTGFNADLYECICETIIQKPNNLIVENFSKSIYHLGKSNIVNIFYSFIADLSLEEVTQMQWANPSYSQHFQNDKSVSEYFEYYKEHALPLYLIYNNLPHDTVLNDDDSQIKFYNWIKENINTIPKTYKQVLNFIFNEKNIFDAAKNPHTSIDNIDSFVNKITNNHTNWTVLT
jgi:hypothetical protein